MSPRADGGNEVDSMQQLSGGFQVSGSCILAGTFSPMGGTGSPTLGGLHATQSLPNGRNTPGNGPPRLNMCLPGLVTRGT